MPEQKNKSENYRNLQGLNQKVSRYITGESEFIKLQNLDAQTPGALVSSYGTTQNLFTGVTGRITGISDFFKTGPTFGSGSATYNLIATTQFDAGNISGQTYATFYHFLFPGNNNQFDFVPSDSIYVANQYEFFKYPAITQAISATFIGPTTGLGTTFLIETPVANYSNAFQYSLPAPLWHGPDGITSGGTGATNGLTGTFSFAAAFVRADGFVGPASYAFTSTFGGSAVQASGQTFIEIPMPTLSIFSGVSLTFSDFGIVGTRIWIDYEAVTSGYYPFANPQAALGPFADMFPLAYGNTLYIVPVVGTPYIPGAFSPSFAISLPDGNKDAHGIDDPTTFQGTFIYGTENNNGATSGISIPIQPTNPATIEIYANELWMGGFLNFPDTIWWSLPGEFEKRDPENFFDFREKDGDIVTCLKAYFTQLIIFKVNSIGAASGSDDTLQVVEVTNQYGCMSANSACVFQQRLWFLDKKGICEYNGANTDIVSNKVEPFFRRMNVNAARNTACMIHVKELNQVQCFIPIDGSETNNLEVFYDYLANFWGTRSISNCTAAAITQQGVNIPVARFGDASGMIYSYGHSLPTDNGQAFTCIAQSRFISGDGSFSDEKMFRRLYLDAAIPPGSTYNFLVNLYADMGASIVYSTTMTLSNHQNRIDFGVPASSLSIELIYSEGNYLTLNGFTVEYRFQRAVSVEQNNGES